MRSGWIGLLGSVLACGGGDESNGDAIATEVGGECIFNAGSYVATYRVLDASASCGQVSALPDEYLTITEGGELAGNDEVPAGCVQSEFVVEGCFVAFERDCAMSTASGTIESHVEFQFEYAEATGLVSVTGNLYSGSVLLESCLFTQEVTIRRR